jgi:tricarballylate dehydrogenase
VVYDVAVVGGGNAALVAALSARERGASVVLLERAPREWRGGNSKYTRNFRCAHEGPDEVMAGTYDVDEFLAELVAVAGDEPIDRGLARLVIERSLGLPAWMERHGVRWQAALRGTLQLSRTNRFFLGGGKALVNVYYEAAARAGVRIVYDAPVTGFRFDAARCTAAVAAFAQGEAAVEARAFVLASGGYEANKEWLARSWGPGASRFVIRGCRYNDGAPVQRLLEAGARPEGVPGAFHGTAVDARSPDFDSGIVTRIDSIPFGIVVNSAGERFYDEGEDLWPKRYATWGRLIAQQEGQTAFSIFDSTVVGRFIPPLYPPVSTPTIAALAEAIGVPAGQLEATVAAYNAATATDARARFDRSRLDGCGTAGLDPPKSNWALPIDTPPFHAFPLRPGITFTYFGVAVDEGARVARADGGAFANLFAAGEAMAGNVLKRGYLAGVGMTIGTVSGRIAGEEAAACAHA